MTGEQYLKLPADDRAMVRCFAALDELPPEALEDMRSLSVQGSSLARQLVDRPVCDKSPLDVAQRMVRIWEDGYQGKARAARERGGLSL
jgi:hypothetical protein